MDVGGLIFILWNKALINNLANVVFPVPRPPCNNIMSDGLLIAASFFAMALSSCKLVLNEIILFKS